MSTKIKIEFHCHTNASRDSLVKPSDLVAHCRRRGIDRVVITDHNTIAGALQAKALDPERVIVGEEIATTKGELLAAFVKEEIPRGLTPKETIKRLREQGAFISVSHPFDTLRGKHWQKEDLIDILSQLDAIEIFNSRCLRPRFNQKAEDFANKHDLLGTSGSDAHTLMELGRGAMHLPNFEDAASLRRALARAKYTRTRSGLVERLASRYAAFRNWYMN
jgi:predicted metal-dependent phosphoesterase TrpH